MSINDLTTKIKSFNRGIWDRVYSQENGLKISNDVFIVALIILVGTASFGLGKISAFEKRKTPISVLKMQNLLLSNTTAEGVASTLSGTQVVEKETEGQTKGIVFASKSGKKYYYPWCSGADRVKEANRVWFDTVEAAKSAGYTPATNCTGLK